MHPPIYGLAGRARSGKDTVGQYILSLRGGYRYGFADPLKRMIAAGFDIEASSKHWEERKEQVIPALGVSLRRMLQTLGTEWGRQYVHPNVWIIVAQDTLRRRGPGMIITDVRFDNEAEWVRREGGLMIHIDRPAVPGVEAHSSEGGVGRKPTDRVINNANGLEELFDRVKRVI